VLLAGSSVVVGGECERRVAVVFVEAGEEVCEVVAGEGPVEGFGDLVVVVFEVVECAGELGGAVEVVGGQQLALDDRVVDLGLV
jgi:hypothetical protein